VDHVILIDVTVAVLVVADNSCHSWLLLYWFILCQHFGRVPFTKGNDWSRNNVVARVE
jgi:hypothetical protein